jgi:hypothetical protein
MAKMIDATVGACATCCAHRRPQSPETLMPHPVPSFPWQKIGADIFTYNRRDNLLVADYFSKFPFILLLPDKTASSVVAMLKSLFSIYGIPITLFADNMPFASQLMQQFASNWNFEIVTSSPGYARSNGQSERCEADDKATVQESGGESNRSAHRATQLQSCSAVRQEPGRIVHEQKIANKAASRFFAANYNYRRKGP